MSVFKRFWGWLTKEDELLSAIKVENTAMKIEAEVVEFPAPPTNTVMEDKPEEKTYQSSNQDFDASTELIKTLTFFSKTQHAALKIQELFTQRHIKFSDLDLLIAEAGLDPAAVECWKSSYLLAQEMMDEDGSEADLNEKVKEIITSGGAAKEVLISEFLPSQAFTAEELRTSSGRAKFREQLAIERKTRADAAALENLNREQKEQRDHEKYQDMIYEKLAHDEANKKFRYWKAYDLIQRMMGKGLLPETKEAIDKQMSEMESWDEEGFAALERVLEQREQPPTNEIEQLEDGEETLQSQFEQALGTSSDGSFASRSPFLARRREREKEMTRLLISGEYAGMMKRDPAPADEARYIREEMEKCFIGSDCLDCKETEAMFKKAAKLINKETRPKKVKTPKKKTGKKKAAKTKTTSKAR